MNFKKLSKKALLTGAFFTFYFVMAFQAHAQNVISGTVVDKNHEGIPGVTILEKGTANGTSTDLDGHFTLNVKTKATLVVSFVGYQTQEVAASGKNLIITLLENSQLLNDVVVVGYGNMQRKDLTSSITTVKSDELNQGIYSNPAQLLQGKVPGLVVTQSSDPNSSPSIIMRGASTLRTGAAVEPYYVIDGIPGADLSLIAPEDIESIDVLRDASATAIYGSKAANGVIIVTTKHGKAGTVSISYNAYVAFDNVSKSLDMMTGDEYRSFLNDNGFSFESGDDAGINTNWQKEVERTGTSQSHNLSVSGGAKDLRFSASVNYLKNNGVIKGTDMDRYVGRSFVEAKALKDKLTVALSLNGSITDRNNVLSEGEGLSVYDAMNYYLPFSPVKNDDGTWFQNTSRSQYYNPVSMIEENTINTKDKFLQAAVKATLDILQGLKYNVNASLENEQYNHNVYYSSNSMAAGGMNGEAIRAAVENEKKVLEMQLTYDKTFADVHKLSLMGGYSWEESNDNNGFQTTVYDFYSDDLSYYNLGLANKVDMDGFGSYYLSTLRMISFYGRANYSYADKYLAQVTVRRDGSSAFGVNNRWATFPSFSLAWRLSEEAFIKNLNVFDNLKLRGGYGVSGNSLGFDVFTATQVYGSTGWYTNSNGDNVHTLGAIRNSNPDLKWEKTGMLNLGLDFAFFNNRLNGSIEWYDKDTKDLIYDYPVSTTKYLYSYMTANVGEIDNKGIELTINIMPIKTKKLTWNTSLNFSHNKNKVVSISNAQYSVDYIDLADVNGAGQSSNKQMRLMEGYPIGEFYTWEWAGYNKDGVSIYYVHDAQTGERTGETTTTPGDKDRAATGSAQPKLTAGWNNTFSYKNLELTVFFNGIFGNKILNATKARYSNVVGNAGNINLLKSVVNTEKVSDYNSHYISDRYLEDGSFIRLSTLSLGYNFKNIMDNQIKDLKLYITVNNLFTMTNYSGLDPEVNLTGLTPGIDNRQTYPRTRTLMFGASINF